MIRGSSTSSMNDEWLSYFGLQRVQGGEKRSAAAAIPQESVERITRRCLLVYPLSSSSSRRLNVYPAAHSLSPQEKRASIRAYEALSRTDARRRGTLKKKKKSAKDLRRRVRAAYDALDSGVRKRLGPTLRTLALNFGPSSPHFRYGLVGEAAATRMRQLEVGLSRRARAEARRSRPCRVALSRVDPGLLDAFSRRAAVRVQRLTGADCVSGLTVPVRRLTPDQVATGLLLPGQVLSRGLLQVRLSRLDEPPLCALCRTLHDPFLVPDSPPKILEPEEMPLPGQLPLGDPESGDSCDIASLASSSAASAQEPCQTKRDSGSPSDNLRAIGVPRQQLLRTSSLPDDCVTRKRRTLPVRASPRVIRRRLSLDDNARVTRSGIKAFSGVLFETRDRSGV